MDESARHGGRCGILSWPGLPNPGRLGKLPMTNATLSVCICTFNRADSLADAVGSILAATPPRGLRLELIIVDNNSSDTTSAVIHRVGQRDSRIVGLFEPKQGKAHALNRGVEKASGEYVLFTDDDVIVTPDWLTCVEESIAKDFPACIGGRILPRWDAKQPVWLGPELYPMLALLDFHSSRCEMQIPKIWGANMCIRRQLIVQLGGFGTRRSRTGRSLCAGDEDTEFVRRLIGAGRRVVYDPAPTVFHRIGSDRLKKSYFRKWCFDQARCDAFGQPGARLEPAVRTLVRRTVSFETWIGDERGRLSRQLDWMRSAGFIVGSMSRRLRLTRTV
jgi:glycosyltransferase involved in cell wall biosynthesis